MTEELKPCPFCGSEAAYDDYDHTCFCTNIPECLAVNSEYLWNTRSLEDALRKQLEDLQSKYDFMLKECKDMETKLEVAEKALRGIRDIAGMTKNDGGTYHLSTNALAEIEQIGGAK